MNTRALVLGLAIALLPLGASAQIIVTPSSAGVSSYQTFDMSVPSARMATVGIKLLIPDGVTGVLPNVKQGWTIGTKKDGDGNVTEIDWVRGSIPAGERDDFFFGAKMPTLGVEADWKAYQTFADGSSIAWDLDPAGKMPTDWSGKTDFSKEGPYSITTIANNATDPVGSVGPGASELASFVLAAAALVVAGLALSRTGTHPHSSNVI